MGAVVLLAILAVFIYCVAKFPVFRRFLKWGFKPTPGGRTIDLARSFTPDHNRDWRAGTMSTVTYKDES